MDIRYRPDEVIRLQLLGPKEHTVSARMIDLSGRRAELELPEPVSLSAPVRVNLEDSMLLGEVCSCVRQGDSYRIAIEVSEAIPSLSSLARLVAAVMNEGRGEEVGRRDRAATR